MAKTECLRYGVAFVGAEIRQCVNRQCGAFRQIQRIGDGSRIVLSGRGGNYGFMMIHGF